MIRSYQNFLKGLGLALRKARLEKGYTQEQLGKKAGRNQSAIYKLERGPVHGVPLNVLFEVAEAIPVSLTELFLEAEAHASHKRSEKKLSSLVKNIESLPNNKKEAVERILNEVLILLPASSNKERISS